VASLSKKTKAKRKRRQSNAGKRRKTVMARKSTPTTAELFAGCGEPGQPIAK